MFHLGLHRDHCISWKDDVLSFVTINLEAKGIPIDIFPPGFIEAVIKHVEWAIRDMTCRDHVPYGLFDVWCEIVIIYLQNVYAVRKDIEDENSEGEGSGEDDGSTGDIKKIRRFTLGDLTIEGYASLDGATSSTRKAWVKANMPDLAETIYNFSHRICKHIKFHY